MHVLALYNRSGKCRRLRRGLGALVPLLAAGTAHADVPIRLNEILINPLGADRGQEFIEISGPAGGAMTGISVVVIEGDATATSSVQKGRIDNVLNLGALAIGDGGLLLLRDGAGIIDCDPGPFSGGPLPTTRTVIFPSSATQSGFGNGSVGLENSSSTFLLVWEFTGSVGQDLDTNNDGTLDVLPWSQVIDAVSVINSSSGPTALAVGYAPQFGGSTISALSTGFDIPMLVRRDDGSWITAPIVGENPTTGPPITGQSGPYFWQPGREVPSVGGAQYYMTPGRPNGAIPNGDSPCGSLRVTVSEGANSLWSNWGYPTFDLAASPVLFDSPPGGSIRQAVGAAVRATFTAPIACRYRFDLCGSEIEDTVMVVLGTCGDATTALAANDEAAGACGPGSSRSAIELALAAGQQVEIAVGSYLSGTDMFPLETGELVLRIRRDTDSDGTFDDEDGCPQDSALTAPLEYRIDADGDGYGGSATGLACALSAPEGYASDDDDCDDDDPHSYPGAVEECDGADNDCDSYIDEGVQLLAYADQDGDGAGDPSASIWVCKVPSGYVTNPNDGCPLEPALMRPVSYFADADGDGFGSVAAAFCSLSPPLGFSSAGSDCDDQSVDTYPNAPELCSTLGTDNDCDGDELDVSVPATFYPDADGDGYGAGAPLQGCPVPTGHSLSDGDCDDADALRRPGAPESCDDIGIDNDCDGNASEITDPRVYYRDADGDGAGDPLDPSFGCEPPDGYVGNGNDDCPADPTLVEAVIHFPDSDEDGYGASAGVGHCSLEPPPGYLMDSRDCDDSRADAYPGASERCSNWGVDNDCDGDAYDADDPRTFYLDADGDGLGDSSVTVAACQAPPGYVAVGGDGCPLNPFAFAPVRWHRDQDSDSFGNPAIFIVSCVQPAGHIPQSTDCDDTRPWINPLGQETCDPLNLDEDCDGVADDADPSAIGKASWYLDADGDSYGSGVPVAACDAPSALHTARGGDCNDDPDADGADAYPGAAELCATAGIDNDCDGNPSEVDADAPDRTAWYGDSDGDGAGDPAVVEISCTQPDGYVAVAGDGCPSEGALTDPLPYFIDSDGDGYGTEATVLHCSVSAPEGYSALTGDCNDDADAEGADAYPGAEELCATAGTDNDCDGDAYETNADAADRALWYGDSDGDGAGDPNVVSVSCTQPEGYVAVAEDACPEEGALTDPLPYFIDSDGDGYGTDATALHCSVSAPEGHSSSGGDCNDDAPSVNPGAAESCNGIDDDCAGGPDDGLQFRDYYVDSDGDGYGDDATSVNACTSPGSGWVEVGGDGCIEDPSKIEPGACGCGALDTDADADGVADCVDNCGDLYNPGQGDCDSDGYGDACAIAAGAADCNANAAPDACDIASGAAADVDGNGQPDECQPDCNANAIPDAWEVAQGITGDCNANGIPDDCEDGSVRDDTGNMGALAAGTSVSATLAGHVPATTAVSVRVDVIADMADPDAYVILTLNGVAVATDLGASAGAACPKIPDAFEIDVSAALWETVVDAAEVPGTVTVTLAASEGIGDAACSNGLSRVRISYGGTGYDCDGDGEPDLCQLASGEGDCDGNGIFDACERGGSGDSDSDGIPDSCERARGDFNLDGFIDGTDLSFVLSAWGATGDHDADLNGDGEVAGEDLAVLLAAWGTLVY